MMNESQTSPSSEETKTVIETAGTPEAGTPPIGYELEQLAIEEPASGTAGLADFASPLPIPSADDPRFTEEIEMIGASLPEPRIEAGDGLIQTLETIPDKMAFKIGEAAEMVGVKQYVLRYWETEFEMLRPRKSKNGQRVYSRKDVETAMMIKKLLYEDRFSIEGARSALKSLKSHVKEERSIRAIVQSQETAVTKLQGLVSEIRRIREIFN